MERLCGEVGDSGRWRDIENSDDTGADVVVAADWIIAACLTNGMKPLDAYLEKIADGGTVGREAGGCLFAISSCSRLYVGLRVQWVIVDSGTLDAFDRIVCDQSSP